VIAEFDFVARVGQAAEARDELSGSSYWVNDQVFVQSFGTALDPAVADLVTVALSCYAADRLTRRPVAWARQFRLRLAVSDPNRWRDAESDLASYLAELTDDDWSFDFIGGRLGRISEQQATLFPVDLKGQGAVALFSGGLDSLAGAAHWLSVDHEPLVLLGARSSTVIGRDQQRVAAGLRERQGARVFELGVPLQLRNAYSVEDSQRTRGFLFLSLATAAAITANVRRVVVFENGYGAHNPRLAEHQWGAQATRSTHPHLLKRFAGLSDVLGLSVVVELPHRWQTKAELLRLMPVDDHDLVALTASCDGYPLRRASFTHCGRCGSCVLRQQSLAAAGLEHLDRVDYVRRPLDRGVEANVVTMLMARQAWLFGELAHIESWAEIAWRWPSLTLGLEDSHWDQRGNVLRLMNEVASEWESLLTERPHLRRHLRWPAPETATTA
jgi:7-cyano-7-deazaguanine synthase in queuosine biosynthesis